MGVAVENALIKIQGTKLKQAGPILSTYWGMSGPAVLKLSSWGARVLNEINYDFKNKYLLERNNARSGIERINCKRI